MAAASRLILAIDLGTSSSRTALFTGDGERVAETTAQQPYPLATSAEGAAELDPQLVLKAIKTCLGKTLSHAREPIAAVGVSCIWQSLIGTDARGKPLTRILTWADARNRREAAELRELLEEKEIHARTGCMLRTSFWPAKLRWLRQTQPRLFRQIRLWLSPAEWLQRQFCGHANCALGMAGGNGLLDANLLKWDAELLEVSGIRPEQLGPLSEEPSESRATGFPQLKGARWYPGIGDGAASNLGSGATRPGLAAINFGTSAALRVMRQGSPAAAPLGLFCYRVDAERYLVGGAISNAGNVRAWCLKELRLDEDPDRQLAERGGPQADLNVLPFWNAERAPTWNEDLRGAIVGLSQHTTALDLLQAITEATYQRLALIAEMVMKEEASPPKFLVSGGIQHSAPAMQRLADVLGYPLYASREPEASLRGAAIFALEKLGGRPTAWKLGRAIRPRRKFAKLYAEARERQSDLESNLRFKI